MNTIRTISYHLQVAIDQKKDWAPQAQFMLKLIQNGMEVERASLLNLLADIYLEESDGILKTPPLGWAYVFLAAVLDEPSLATVRWDNEALPLPVHPNPNPYKGANRFTKMFL